MKAITTTDYHFSPNQQVYRGKVRDVYRIGDIMVMIATDRISAFDHVLPRAIPYKGQVLNGIAAHFLKATAGQVPNWLLAVPHPNVSIGYACEALPIEMVVRGYLAGHAARTYKSGIRTLCGVTLPEGLKEGDRLPEPIITPTTKAAEGHDMDISREEILAQGLVAPELYKQMEQYTRMLYTLGTDMASKRGLLLVDTKYEFGLRDGKVLLIDEVHTPDSSRYYYADGYEERQEKGLPQQQLSKEFVREWLMSQGFEGKEGQTMPNMPDAFVQEVSERYIQLYEHITGETFLRTDDPPEENVIREELKKW